jgi:hypothetical protein
MGIYQTDLHAWIEEQAELLRAGHHARLDVPNLVEELERLARRERRALTDQRCNGFNQKPL